MRKLRIRIAAAAAAGAVVALTVGVGAASAHVTVNPREAVQGGYAKLAFRVPNEKDAASTTKLEVYVPTDTPIPSVSVKPVPGWTAAVATDKITWTAAGPDTAVQPGQFQEFEVSAGPLPKVDRIVFKALQTYSNGEVVRWIDVPADGQEADHPAPVLTLTRAASPAATAGVTVVSAAADSGPGDGAALALGAAGLAAGLIALAFSVLTWRRTA